MIIFMKYEKDKWKLLNVNKLPRDNKKRIDYKNCIGIILKYEFKPNGSIYDINIVEYIKDYTEEDNKTVMSQFKIQYIYLKGTENEEIIERFIFCNDLINKVAISGVIPSLNQWIKKDNYWIGVDTKGREFKFSTNDKETEYNILHSTWHIDGRGYAMGRLNNSRQSWQLHKVVYFNCNREKANRNIHMCIDHLNNDKTDNRINNLRLVTKSENNKNIITSNKFGLTGIKKNGKGYCSKFTIEGHDINIKTKYDLEEAKIDNLIAQRYLGFKHNEDQFYKLEGLSEERIKEVTDNLDRQIENNKNKVKKQKEHAYDYIEKDNLIGIKTLKRDGTPNEICWVDKDFGRIEGDKYVVNGNIYNNGKGYFNICKNRINVYMMTGELYIYNYRNNNFHIDHINQRINENYKDNLEIVTIQSNMFNKKGRGWYNIKRKNGIKYIVKYAYNWEYFNLYIGGLKISTLDTEEEAIAEYKRRKEIVDKYRFRIGWQGSKEANIKALDEVISFAEEHGLDLDSAYIVWKGLDTLGNIKNYLKDIDK